MIRFAIATFDGSQNLENEKGEVNRESFVKLLAWSNGYLWWGVTAISFWTTTDPMQACFLYSSRYKSLAT